MDAVRGRSYVNAFPLQVIYLVYSVLFGIVLYEVGFSLFIWGGSSVLLLSMGLGFRRLNEQDVPLASGMLYLGGVGAAYLLFFIEFPQELITVGLLIVLFALGIIGNLLYFLSEKQKLSYLNGQIAEEGMTLRKVERYFPLWLIVGGNILLVFAITPLLWALLYQMTGTKLFWVREAGPTWGFFERSFELQTKLTLWNWFGYLLGNVNQSFLGLASLIGIEFSDKEIMPTGLGKAVVLVFRVGTISLALGAVKRWLDLRATTQRLIIALGRASWELEVREAKAEGRKSEIEDWQVLDGRRQMWQIRLQQLLHLYPAQMDRVMSMMMGKGLWQIELKSKIKKSKKKTLRTEQPGSLANHIRAELAEVVGDPLLYVGDPARRYEVMRTLLKLLRSHQDEALAAEIRQKGVLTLVHLLRSNDPAHMRQRVDECVALLARPVKTDEDDVWESMMQQRAALAATYGLVFRGERSRLAAMLPAMRTTGTMLQSDVRRYIEWLSRDLTMGSAATLSAVQRLVEQARGADETVVPVLDELQLALQQLSGKADAPYRRFAAQALGFCLKEEISDPDVQARTARALVACGAWDAVPTAWRLFKFGGVKLRGIVLQAFIDAGAMGLLMRYLRKVLRDGSKNKQILAAHLLGQMPAQKINRSALLEKAQQDDVNTEVRWMVLRSLADLAHNDDLEALLALDIPREQTRLWAVWKYACYCCGDADSMVESIDVLAGDSADEETLREGVSEVLIHGRPQEGPALELLLNGKAHRDERKEASEVLVSRKSPLALLALGHLLTGGKKQPRALRQTAAEDLGVLGRSMHLDQIEALGNKCSPAEWVAPTLLHALEHDTDRLVRIRAARALGRLGLSDIRNKFEQLLIDPDENAQLRQVVAQAVGELGDPAWMEFLLERFPQEKSLQVRQGMVRALDLLGADAEFFLNCLEEEKNAKVLQLTIKSLGQRPLRPEEQERLLLFLDGSAREVRAAAAETLGAQSVEAAFTPLLTRIDHEQESDKDVRRASIKALRRLALAFGLQEELRPHLEKAFREDPDHLVVQDIGYVLARLYGTDAGPLLLEAVEKRKEREPWKKGFAGIIRSLGETRWSEAGPYLYERLQKELRAESLHLPRLIASIRPAGLAMGSESLPVLLELVYRNEPAFSWIAAQVIAELGDPAAIEPLTRYLEDKRADRTLGPDTEAAILFALVRLGSWDRVAEFVNLIFDNDRPIARRRALALMPDMNVGLSTAALLQAMHPGQTSHEKVRETAVKSMGQLSGRLDITLQALRWQATSDPRAKIREAAQDAIRNINSQVQEAIYTIDDVPTLKASSPIAFRAESVHPVFDEVYGNVDATRPRRSVPRAVVPLPTRAPRTQRPQDTTPTVKETRKPAVKETHQQKLTKALAKNEHSKVRKLLAEENPTNNQPIWQKFRAWLDALDAFQEGTKGWSFAPGNPAGSAAYWPFLIMQQPVSRREYLEFCQETGHSLPEGWKPDSKQLKYPNNPVTGISWWDAEAYANHKGWQLPTHEQVVMGQALVLNDVGGTVTTWHDAAPLGEWTSSWSSRRRRLIRTYPPPHTARSSYQREERSDTLTFRCVSRLDCTKDLMEQLVAWQLHLYLPDLLVSCATQMKLSLHAEVAEKIQPILQRPSLPLVNADALEVQGVVRTPAASKPPPKPPKPKVTSTDKFWKRLQDGNWKKALNLLRAAPADLDPKLKVLEEPLSQLWDWLQKHEDAVWIGGSWQGRSLERPFLLKKTPVTRKVYAEFCKASGTAMPRGASRHAKQISDPNQPVTGVSLYDAKRFAQELAGELPSIELLERANKTYPLEGGVTEWTTTPYRHNRRLIRCFTPGYGSARKTFRVDETQAPVGFRVTYPLRQHELPSLLLELQESLPGGIAIENLPNFFSERMKGHLEQMVNNAS